MESPSTTQPSGPEKPGAARLSSPPQPANGQHAQQNLQNLGPLEIPQPEPFRTSKPFAVSKFVLGSFNLAFAIIALGLTLGLISTSYNLTSFIGVVICMALAIASIVWQLAEHATLLLRRDWRSIHPGAHVGVHLVLWVLAILTVLSLWASLASEMRHYVLDSDCADDYWSSSYSSGSSTDPYYCSFYRFPSQAAADRYFGMFQALAAFATLLFICHFALFVMACVETDQRRRYSKATKVVYFLAAPGPVDGRMHYTPVTTQALGSSNRASVLPPQAVYQQQQQQQQSNADPGAHGYYAPPARVAPGTAA